MLTLEPQEQSPPLMSITVVLSRDSSCFTEKHTPLIVVCSICAAVVFAVIVYLIATECKHRIAVCIEEIQE